MMTQAPEYTEASTSKYIQAGDVRIHYNEVGTGEPLLAIHGGGPGATGWSNFNQNIPELAKHFRLILIDLPQYGKSDPVVIHGPRFSYYANAVKNFVDALGIDTINILGNSLGGATAMKFAIDYPDRIAKLMVMGAPTGGPSIFSPMPAEGIKRLNYAFDHPSKESIHEMIKVFVYDSSFVTDTLLEQRLAAAQNPAILEARAKSTGGLEDLTPDLHKIQAPTLVLWGRDDRFVPLDFALTFIWRIPNAHLHVFPHCGHWVQYEGKDAFNRIVIDWVGNQ